MRTFGAGIHSFGLSFSPDGRYLASGSADAQIYYWDVQTGVCLRQFAGHQGWSMNVCFHPHGDRFVSAGADDSVRLWDVASGKELKQIRSDPIQRFAFSPEGKRLVTVSFDGAVVLRDAITMEEVITLRRSSGAPPSSVSFSQDGLTLAVSDENGFVKVWQAGPKSVSLLTDARDYREFFEPTGAHVETCCLYDEDRA